MQEQMKRIEYIVREYPERKEACLVKYVDGFETTSIVTRAAWRKHGRQGAWQKCAAHPLHTKS